MLFTENQLYSINPLSILDECMYLTKDESTIYPQEIPIIENSRIGYNIVRFNDIESFMEDSNLSLNDAMYILAESNNIDPNDIAISIPEEDIIAYPELVNEVSNIVIEPINENDIEVQFVYECVDSYVNTGNEEYLQAIMEDSIEVLNEYLTDTQHDILKNSELSLQDKSAILKRYNAKNTTISDKLLNIVISTKKPGYSGSGGSYKGFKNQYVEKFMAKKLCRSLEKLLKYSKTNSPKIKFSRDPKEEPKGILDDFKEKLYLFSRNNLSEKDTKAKMFDYYDKYTQFLVRKGVISQPDKDENMRYLRSTKSPFEDFGREKKITQDRNVQGHKANRRAIKLGLSGEKYKYEDPTNYRKIPINLADQEAKKLENKGITQDSLNQVKHGHKIAHNINLGITGLKNDRATRNTMGDLLKGKITAAYRKGNMEFLNDYPEPRRNPDVNNEIEPVQAGVAQLQPQPQPKTNTNPSRFSRTINWIKNNKLKTGLGVAAASAAIGGGIYAYKQYKNKPKSVIGKRIAALRNIYRKYMLSAQKNPSKAGIFKKIAAKILSVIDKLMGYLQNAAG